MFLKAGAVAFAAMVIQSCATVFTPYTTSPRISGIKAEQRSNGYIFKIEAHGKIGRVEAWVGPDNWLYMSIPDTSVNQAGADALRGCPIVSDMRFFRYRESVQVTLHLNQIFDHVSVINYPNDDNVYVVLYKPNK